MSNAKQGLVIYYSVDSAPVLCEQKHKKLAARNSGVSSKSQWEKYGLRSVTVDGQVSPWRHVCVEKCRIGGFFCEFLQTLVFHRTCSLPSRQKHALKAAGDKLLMNKFIRQNSGGGLTLKSFISWTFGSRFRWNLTESLGNGGSATRLFFVW